MSLPAVAVLWALGAAGSTALQDPASSLASLREAIATGDFDSAVALGERLVGDRPGSSQAQDLLGRAYGRKAEESAALSQVRLARKARAAFARAVEIDPSNAEALADLTTYDLRAPRLLGGSRTRARETAEQVLRLDPARGHELLGTIAESDGDFSAAESQFRLSLDPSAPLRGRRALSEFLVRRKRYAQARDLWRGAEDPASTDPAPAYELAGIALTSGVDLQEASEELTRWLGREPPAQDPRPAEIHRRLALVAERLGRKADAREHLAEALRLEPRQRGWQRDLARLSR